MESDPHGHARALPPPPVPKERAGTGRAAREPREHAAEVGRPHRERWEWGGRPPSAALRGVGGNVLGLLRFDPGLVHALDAAGPGVQRRVAVRAAHRACEAAGLTGLPWIARALTALDAGRPLPPPFGDHDAMFAALRADPRVPDRSVLEAVPPERPPYRPPEPGPRGRTVVTVQPARLPRPPHLISQPHYALPALPAAADPHPLRAALDAVWHALNTEGEHYPRLLAEVRSACGLPGR
ncbi:MULTISPECIES: hypothetical protein [Streptomyces]|uniref:Uncharacterized protein n=2 Tax=Streptomyces TaxID=1883 RepID=A0ABT9LIQ1_STRGD|nr:MULTISPECIES: hypothetical protein [Streptomyces]MDP9683591.1 hypothetical protein [Streptomyces griseoviridis]GGS93813.1 hypothetical protein GCM10010240_29050 [Streptomyces griseoviridis]GGU21553.1 hypothetical protein GCM10010259_09790 [Streptomyces daghestanicus]GHI31466.1 hypothetical protein Sdagh_31960 [Streptomyces daghestanicus]